MFVFRDITVSDSLDPKDTEFLAMTLPSPFSAVSHSAVSHKNFALPVSCFSIFFELDTNVKTAGKLKLKHPKTKQWKLALRGKKREMRGKR
jgi:hypothetical protein